MDESGERQKKEGVIRKRDMEQEGELLREI